MGSMSIYIGTNGPNKLKSSHYSEVRGLGGNDFLHFTGARDAALYGGSGADRVLGHSGNDLLNGGRGADTLGGGGGDDIIHGGAGKDHIFGGAGNDILIGGSGSDRFYFGHDGEDIGFQKDVIRDFKPGVDDIRIDPDGNRGPYRELAGNEFFVGRLRDADDSAVIIYNPNNGSLFYAVFGDPIKICNLAGTPDVNASDVLIQI